MTLTNEELAEVRLIREALARIAQELARQNDMAERHEDRKVQQNW